jgi:hypothetical protein
VATENGKLRLGLAKRFLAMWSVPPWNVYASRAQGL